MKDRDRRFWTLSNTSDLEVLPALCRKSEAGKWFCYVLLIVFLTVSFLLLLKEPSSADGDSGSSRNYLSEKYGNIILSRKCVSAGQKEVLFTHWTHRILFACRICHLELGFPMRVNEIEITMDMNRSGKFCGFCHNGVDTFGFTEQDCQKCHHGPEDFDYGAKVDRLSWLPESSYGNKVDWSAALEEKKIKPIFCFDGKTCKTFDFNPPDEIEMSSGREKISPVLLPHARHTFWLDCLNCHRGNLILTSGELRFPNQKIMRRDICEGCHGRVAFPMDNCDRCHPGMGDDW